MAGAGGSEGSSDNNSSRRTPRGNRNSGERLRRRVPNINDQIDRIQDASLQRSSRNISRYFDQQIQAQLDAVRNLYSSMSAEEKQHTRESMREQQLRMKQSLQGWKDHYDEIKDQMTVTEKIAGKLFYWNRRRDLRDLERESRYRFDDIADNAENALSKIGEQISSISEGLRDWSTALNVDRLANGLEDTAQSVYESKKQLQKLTGLDKTQMGRLSNSAGQASKDSGYVVAKEAYMETYTQIAEQGYKDVDFMVALGKSLTDLQATVDGIDVSSLENLMQYADKYGTEQADMYTQLARAVTDSQELYSSGADIMAQFESQYSDVLYRSGGDLEKFNQMMQNRLAGFSMLNDNWLDGQAESIYDLFGRLNDMTDTDAVEQLIAMAGSSASSIRQSAMSGDYTQATRDLILAIKDNYNNGNADTMASALNMDKSQLQEIIVQMQQVNAASLDQNIANFENAVTDAMTGDPIERALHDAYISPLDKLQNWLSASKLGSIVDEFISSTGMSLTDLAVLGNILGKSLSSIGKFAGKFLGGGGGASGGSGGGGILNLLGKGLTGAKNFFSAGFGGAGADTAAGALGMKVLGFGAPGGMATLGTGGAMSAGLLATGGMALGGGLMMANDAMNGAGMANEWLGRDDTSAKVMSGVGGALGGTGPGWADEGSVIDKAGNTLAGAGKGALIGGAIGSIIPGLGTAIGAAIGGGVGAIGAAIGGEKIAGALDWLGKKASGIWDGVKKTAGKVWDGITDFGKKSWDGIKNFSKNAWNGIKNLGVDAFNTTVGVGDMAMEGLFNAMGLDWDGFKTKMFDGWNNIKEVASQKWTEIKDWASGTWDTLSTKAGEVWDGVSTKAGEIWDGISTKAGEIWGGITDIASSAWDTVSEHAKDVLQGLGDFFSDIWEGITDAIDDAGEWVSDRVDDAGDWLSDRWDDVTSFFGGAKDRGEDITGIDGSHRAGLENVPRDGYIAELHKGEAVLTADEAKQWRSLIGGVGNAFGSIKSNISGLFKGDSENAIVNFANNFYDKGSEAIDKFKGFMQDRMTDVKDTGNDVFDIWQDDSLTLWDKTKQTATKMFDGLKKTGESVFKVFRTSLNSIFSDDSAIGTVANNLGTFGSSITSSITSSISGLTSSIFNLFNRNDNKPEVDGSHENGLDRVPKDGYIAELHKDEAVLTADQANDWRNANGLAATNFFSNMYRTAQIDKQALINSYLASTGDILDGSSSGSYVSGDYIASNLTGDNKKDIWSYLKSIGLSDYAASGIMGCWEAESSNNPNTVEGFYLKSYPGDSVVLANKKSLSDYTQNILWPAYARSGISISKKGYSGGDGYYYPGFGLAQWTGPRVGKLMNFADSHGGRWQDLSTQLGFFKSEFDQRGLADKMNAAQSVAAATSAFFDGFEMYAGASQKMTSAINKRSGYANSIYNQFAGTANPTASYDTGTPWVPNDQVALIHEGEMIVPADYNPESGSTKTLDTDNDDSSIDDLIDIVKWGIETLEKAINNSGRQVSFSLANANRSSRAGRTETDAVFGFSR